MTQSQGSTVCTHYDSRLPGGNVADHYTPASAEAGVIFLGVIILPLLDRPASFVNKWHNPQGLQKIIAILIVALLLIAVVLLVYFTGGVRFVYAHLIYVPILLSAVFFGISGATVTAILAGISLGPFMPVDTLTGEQQHAINWLLRLGIFTVVGSMSGFSVDALHRAAQKVYLAANHDSFTGLPNQHHMQRTLEELIQDHENTTVKLLVINIDNYIELFYTFGAETCNSLLKHVYLRLQKLIPGDPLIFQLQTNKFGIILVDSGFNTAMENDIIRYASSAFQKVTFEVENIPLYIEFSVGIASYPEHTNHADVLIQKAGIALYSAKKKLANYAYYDPHSDWTNIGNLELIGSVPKALDQEQFVLYYQPIYNIQHNVICGVEALVRWRHPLKGLLQPGDFITEVERTALIHPFTRWVLSTALDQIKIWLDLGHRISVSVNISAKSLKDTELTSFIQKELTRTKVPPENLELEITENAVMDDYQNAVEILSVIRDLGVKVSIDDFGTGLTSLAYLKELPIDTVKIDRTFIQNVSHDISDQAIVSATLTMANSLGLLVTAEGVENENTVTLLRKLGCDKVQGYYYYKPAPVKDITALLNTYLSSKSLYTSR